LEHCTSIAGWWEAVVKTVPKEEKTKIQWPMHLRHVEFVERMKPRIFQNKSSTPLTVALHIKEDMEQWQRAFQTM
jgi:hypothetical protein